MFSIFNKKPVESKILPDINSPRTPVRTNCVIGLVGVNKTGKSSKQEEMARAWRGSRPSSHIIKGFDYQHMFKKRKDGGLLDSEIDMANPDWALDCCNVRNGLILLDEIKLLMRTPQHIPKGVDELFSQCFYKNVDIFWSCHNPSSVPDIVTHFTTHYYIYLTFAKEGSFRKKIPNYSLCTEASEIVNTYVSLFGRGYHKKDKRYTGQGFPHIIVDTEKQTLIRQNMPRYDELLKHMETVKKSKDIETNIQ